MHMSGSFLGTVSTRRPDTAAAQPTWAWELNEAASGGAVLHRVRRESPLLSVICHSVFTLMVDLLESPYPRRGSKCKEVRSLLHSARVCDSIPPAS